MRHSETKNDPDSKYPFLSVRGEMGRLTRDKDWGMTPMGPVEHWPQSLRTVLAIVLRSKFPKFLWWGPELICFYNDAYRPSLGNDGKHPGILGMPAQEAWPEIWDVIKPLIDQVLENDESLWREDQLIPIYRNARMEEVYWTFSYTSVIDESGKPAGVLVTCMETTEKVKLLREIKRSKDQLSFALEAADLGTWDMDPQTNSLITDIRLQKWFGLPSGSEEFHQLTDHVAERDRQRVADAIAKALSPGSGGNYEIEYAAINPLTREERRVLAKGKALFNEDQVAFRFSGILQDITPQVLAMKKLQDAEGRLRLTMQATGLATWELDLITGNIIYSQRIPEIFGHNSAAVMSHGDMRRQVVADDLHQILEKAFDEALVSGKYNYEVRIVRPDHEIRWIATQGAAIYDEGNRPVKMIGTTRDITDEKNHQQKIEESEARFRLLADSMPQFVWSGDRQGTLNYFNRAVFDYSGMTEAQILEKGWLQIIHPDEREENTRQWAEAVSTGQHFIFEHRFRRHDGEYRWQLSRAIPLKDSLGAIQKWIGTSTDIQELKEQEQQKDYFLSMASHELKTPITSIKGYVQILLSKYEQSNDAFLMKSLQTVDKQIIKLTNLISDLLDVSKIKLGSLLLNKEKFGINGLVEDIIDQINHVRPDCHIIFCRDEETVVFADRERIGQVLINLLTNAIKYSPKSHEIKVESKLSQEHILISVIDQGIGISKKEQEKIFERFYRVEGKDEKTFPGFGIGLYIAGEIIARHHGNIGVESTPGKGATFSFSLPLKNPSSSISRSL